MPAAAARRTRYNTPQWAERFPDTPEGLDAMHNHGEARKLPRHTDPDSIADPDVRDAFLQQMQDEANDDSGAGTGGGASRRTSTRNASRSTRGNASPGSLFSLPASLGSSIFGLLVYAMAVNYVRGGGTQLRQWFSAKFTNGGGALS